MIALYVMAVVYILAGINHFIKPQFYLKIMPPYIPNHELMVKLSGIIEVVLGIGLLFSQTRSWSAWGIVLMLIAIFPANIYMLTSDKFSRIPKWFLWLRLPIQGVLIWWASLYI